jgi:hypothetical protein
VSIDVELRSRTGETVERFRGEGSLLADALPPEADETYHCLGYIDPYDETVFNEPQVTRLVAELERRRAQLTGDQADYFGLLLDIARRAEREHLRIAFVGD